jgi:hypothetical protein
MLSPVNCVGSQGIDSRTFPVLQLTVEQVLAAGNAE